MMTATVDLSGLHAGINGLIQKVGLNSRVVVKKETGELIKTLVRLSPKAKPANIRHDIQRKFDIVANDSLSNMQHGRGDKWVTGPSGITWYSVDKDFLRGVAPTLDMRKESVQALKKVLYTLTGKESRKMGFRHPRGHQRVSISQTIVTKRSTLRQLIAAKVKNRGRLAAAWLVAVAKGAIALSGGNMPTQQVMKHVDPSKSRGTYIDGTSTGTKPTFTIINRAVGIGSRQVRSIVQTAANIRAKAMQANVALFLRGKKKLSQYR